MSNRLLLNATVFIFRQNVYADVFIVLLSYEQVLDHCRKPNLKYFYEKNCVMNYEF
jgi:hypothetical protein